MLMEQLPARVYNGERHVEDLQQAIERPLAELAGCRDELLRQVRVSTADSWGLALWEQAYGLAPSPGKDAAWRRARVLAKMRGSATTTKEVLERMVEGFAPGGATVKEIPAEYRLEIVLHHSNGARDTTEALIRAVEEVKPAHLALSLAVELPQASAACGIAAAIGCVYSVTMLPQIGENPAFACTERVGAVAYHVAATRLPEITMNNKEEVS